MTGYQSKRAAARDKVTDIDGHVVRDVRKPKKNFQALTNEEVEKAMEQSKGAPDRLKMFNDLLDDMLWKKTN
jgi:hypothetical protein